MCVCVCEPELLATDEVHKCENEREKASADVLFTNESLNQLFEYHMTLRENIDTMCLVWKHSDNHTAM